MSAPTRLVALGVSYHNTPLDMRERFAVAPDRMTELYKHLRSSPGVHEMLVLSTCNRFEVYCVIESQEAVAPLEAALCAFQQIEPSEFAQYRYALRDRDAVSHLLAVASGIDSQIVGETEIFGQVKSAYSSAVSQGAAGPVLNRVVQKCFQAAKFIRTSTPIGAGQISVATVSVDLTEKIFGALDSCRALVIGTGEIGEKTARAMASRGAAAITVLSRSLERALALAATVDGRAGTLDRLPQSLAEHDIVIGSTSVSEPLVSEIMVRSLMKTRKLRPLFFIDLGIPRNFDPALGRVHSVFLYDLDDLARIADENLAARRGAVDKCRRIVQEKALRIWEGAAPRIGPDPPLPAGRDLQARGQAV
ncbi:MAG: glutamyl-tRNA reductase [Opitutaceae bacterium]